MIGTLRKHSGWVWAVVITATIISFVYWGSQSSQVGGGGGGSFERGSINGEKISAESYANVYRELELRYFFSRGDWPGREAQGLGFDMEKEPYYRLLLLQKARELNVHASSEAVAQVASEVLRSINRGTDVPLSVFEKQVLRPHGLTTEDFERWIRNDLVLQQLISIVNLSGKLITPQEAQSLYRYENEALSTEAVFFTASNYLAQVSAPPEVVSQFYSNNLARYRLPQRVQVSYVWFNVTNSLAAAEGELVKTNLDEMIEANYRQLGTNYFRDAKTPEEIKARIRTELIRLRALSQVHRQASEFARVLFDLTPARADNLDKLARESNLVAQVSAPFDQEQGPADLKVRADFVKAAFALTPEEPFAGPLRGEDGSYVIASRQTLAERTQSLEEIRDRVTADCKYSLAVQQARQAGLAFYNAVTNGMARGKGFTTVCAEEKVSPVPLPPVSRSTRELPEVEERLSLYQLQQVAFDTPVGKVGGFAQTPDGGLVLYVRARLPVDEAKMLADMPAFLNSVRQARQGEAFNLWFRREAERGLRDTPVFRPAQTTLTGQAAK